MKYLSLDGEDRCITVGAPPALLKGRKSASEQASEAAARSARKIRRSLSGSKVRSLELGRSRKGLGTQE